MAALISLRQMSHALAGAKHYKVVRHPTKPYIRNYKREVKGGLTLLEAVFEETYARFPTNYPELFSEVS